MRNSDQHQHTSQFESSQLKLLSVCLSIQAPQQKPPQTDSRAAVPEERSLDATVSLNFSTFSIPADEKKLYFDLD